MTNTGAWYSIKVGRISGIHEKCWGGERLRQCAIRDSARCAHAPASAYRHIEKALPPPLAALRREVGSDG